MADPSAKRETFAVYLGVAGVVALVVGTVGFKLSSSLEAYVSFGLLALLGLVLGYFSWFVQPPPGVKRK